MKGFYCLIALSNAIALPTPINNDEPFTPSDFEPPPRNNFINLNPPTLRHGPLDDFIREDIGINDMNDHLPSLNDFTDSNTRNRNIPFRPQRLELNDITGHSDFETPPRFNRMNLNPQPPRQERFDFSETIPQISQPLRPYEIGSEEFSPLRPKRLEFGDISSAELQEDIGHALDEEELNELGDMDVVFETSPRKNGD
jgi:hypothetical protein